MTDRLGSPGGQHRVGPGRLVALAELFAPLEYAVALTTRRLFPRPPRGDRTVLVLPGFLANDTTTWKLRDDLRRLGHDAHGWRGGFNIGPSQRIVDGLLGRLDDVAADAGRKVDVIGWSLGGVYARWLATERTELVSSVITLGSPIRPIGRREGAVGKIFGALGGRHDADLGDFDPSQRLAVPVTSIWTRTDGVVDWKAAAARPGPESENIEVPGTHLGLPVNPYVLHVIADRLSQPVGVWNPYRHRAGLGLPSLQLMADADRAAASVWDDFDDDEPDDYISPLLRDRTD